MHYLQPNPDQVQALDQSSKGMRIVTGTQIGSDAWRSPFAKKYAGAEAQNSHAEKIGTHQHRRDAPAVFALSLRVLDPVTGEARLSAWRSGTGHSICFRCRGAVLHRECKGDAKRPEEYRNRNR